MNVQLEEKNILLGNVYAPTKDKPNEHKSFLQSIKHKMQPYIDCDILMGGDFNCCTLPELDKKGGLCENQSQYAKDLISLQVDFQLADIWRLRHPTLRRFTSREKTASGYVQSRLDYWLVSAHMEYIYSVNKIKVIPGRRSDHSLVKLQLEIDNKPKRGTGFWKFNTTLLKDETYLNDMKLLIHDLKQKYRDLLDKQLVWDVMKCGIRTATIRYAIQKCKNKKQMEVELERKLHELEEKLDRTPNDSIQSEYEAVTNELNNILMHKTKGAMLRSRAKWLEGEKTPLIS